MNHLDCPRLSEHHNELLNDIQLCEFIRSALDKNWIEQAKEEMDIYVKRLKERNKEITGRA